MNGTKTVYAIAVPRISLNGDHQFFRKKIEIGIAFPIDNEVVSGLMAERMEKAFNFIKEAN